MPTPSSVIAFAALSFALIIVPGPSVMFVISRGVALGRSGALLTVIGNAAGVFVQVALVAAGLGAIVQRSITVFTVVKFAGAAYLIWLGVQAIRHRHDLTTPDQLSTASTPRSVVVDGFIVGVANPKAIVFFAAILPQYVSSGEGSIPAQMLVLGLVFVALALVLDSIWAMLAGTARAWFSQSPRRLARLSTIGGATMIGLGAQLALTGKAE